MSAMKSTPKSARRYANDSEVADAGNGVGSRIGGEVDDDVGSEVGSEIGGRRMKSADDGKDNRGSKTRFQNGDYELQGSD